MTIGDAIDIVEDLDTIKTYLLRVALYLGKFEDSPFKQRILNMIDNDFKSMDRMIEINKEAHFLS